MQNPIEEPKGLLQSTEFTHPANPNGTLTIRCVTGDETRDLISFTNVPEVYDFYKQRGVAPGITQQTNAVSIRVLALDLMNAAEQQAANGEPQSEETAAHAKRLHQAAKTVQKGDSLLCSYEVERPVTL